MGVWAASLPAMDERLDLGTGRTGTVLLLVSLGALVSMQGAGRVADRFSSRRLCLISGPLHALLLLGPALSGSYAALLAWAFVFGLGFGLLEIGMNAHAVEVEERYARPIMSAFHGMWSLGGAVGGLVTAAALRSGLGVSALLTATALVGAVLFLLPGRFLLRDRLMPEPEEVAGDGQADRRVPVKGAITLLGIVVFAGSVSEGAAVDWAAMHARRVLDAGPELAALAFTVYSVAMTTMRFLGDRLRGRLGGALTLRLAGSLAAAGYVVVLLAPALGGAAMVFAWTGWVLVGTGLATIVPVAFSAVGASQQAAGRALALVTTFGYCGLLAGPAVIGHLAEVTSLRAALVLPVGLAIFVALAGPGALTALTRHRWTPRAEPVTVSRYS
ncbi:MFS transporter [Actinomadura rudentiformis]|uniref:MFS transporter n=1 Tax=Actinomadura rudentiformis TaxID=359158 RepID=A0A6H9YLR5_9ACTN|nr:MFS transporter [Actinomadura rudentiformis]